MDAIFGLFQDASPQSTKKISFDRSLSLFPGYQVSCAYFEGGMLGMFSCHGMQPYCCSNTSITVVFTGRIADRVHLCHTLAVPTKACNSQLVAVAYQKWGQDLTMHVIGDYQFALWDGCARQLFAAQSPMYKGGLLYRHQMGQLVVASLFPLFKDLTGETPKLNPERIVQFLALDRAANNNSFYQDIENLSHGHSLVFCHNNLRITPNWNVQDYVEDPLTQLSQDAAAEQLFDLLEKSVADCLPGAGNVAAHLSGGLDSSSVSALVASLLSSQGRQVEAIGVVPNPNLSFPLRKNWSLDDRVLMTEVANQYPNISLNFIQDDQCATSLPVVSRLCYELGGGPLRNALNIPWVLDSYALCQSKALSHLLIGGGGNTTISWRGMHSRSWLRRVASQCKAIWRKKEKRSQQAYCLLSSHALEKYSPGILPKTSNQIEMFVRAQYAASGITRSGLISYHQINVCDPTLDRRVTEFCLRLPNNHYYHEGKSRLLIRNAMNGMLPDSVRLNTSRGEQNPGWYAQLYACKAHYEELLEKFDRNPLIAEIFDLAEMRILLANMKKGLPDRCDIKYLLWQYRYRLARSLHVAEWMHLHGG